MKKAVTVIGGVLITMSIATVFIFGNNASGWQRNSQLDKSAVQQPLSGGIINTAVSNTGGGIQYEEASQEINQAERAKGIYLQQAPQDKISDSNDLTISNGTSPFGGTVGDCCGIR